MTAAMILSRSLVQQKGRGFSLGSAQPSATRSGHARRASAGCYDPPRLPPTGSGRRRLPQQRCLRAWHKLASQPQHGNPVRNSSIRIDPLGTRLHPGNTANFLPNVPLHVYKRELADHGQVIDGVRPPNTGNEASLCRRAADGRGASIL